jgi:hypothetical protein
VTHCNPERIRFTRVFRRSLQADTQGGTITSDAGSLLLREADRDLAFTESLARCIPDPRDPRKTTHSVLAMLRQRVYGIALGYEDLNDHDSLRLDDVFKILAEKDEDLASSPTLCRFENRIPREALWRMSGVFVDAFVRSFDVPPEEIVLDLDATDDRVHGGQEGRFFHGYYDHYCFLPLYVFCGPQLLAAYLRPSNIDASKHSRPVLRLLVNRLRKAWPGVRIVLRADSGFARWKLMRWCDREGIDYVLGLARNPRLLQKAKALMARAERRFRKTEAKQRLFGAFAYGADTWDRKRRVIAKAEHGSQGSNPRFVVTSLEGAPETIYDWIYCARGDMENRIKEQQLDLFADRTSAHHFLTNQFRLLLASAAYVLLDHIRAKGLEGTELASAQCGTIRLKLLKIGARIVRSARRIVVHVSSAYPFFRLLAVAVARLCPT